MQTVLPLPLRQPLRVDYRRVSMWRPFVWLGRGAVDFVRCWPSNGAHGLLMVILGWVLLFTLGAHPYFVAAAVSGFLLVAPVMTTGLCELSRLRAARAPLTFDASLDVLSRDGRELMRYGAILAAIAIAWFLISETLLGSLLDVRAPGMAETFYRGFLDTASAPQLTAYVASGAVLALIVFAISVVTVPLIIDRRASAGQAIQGSLAVVRHNPMAMLVWAALIVAATVLGFATMLFGMVVLIPMLGHATWQAYRELVAA